MKALNINRKKIVCGTIKIYLCSNRLYICLIEIRCHHHPCFEVEYPCKNPQDLRPQTYKHGRIYLPLKACEIDRTETANRPQSILEILTRPLPLQSLCRRQKFDWKWSFVVMILHISFQSIRFMDHVGLFNCTVSHKLPTGLPCAVTAFESPMFL